MAINALKHNAVSHLPRGELFISRGFLDHFFSKEEGDYVRQLERAAQWLGLSVIGVELDPEWSRSLLLETGYGKLEQYFTVGCLNGPVSSLIGYHGFLEAMSSMKNNQSLFSDVATKLLTHTKEKASLARVNGFRAIALTDDIAGNRGLFFSLSYFVDRVWPIYREIAGIIKGSGLFAFFHSDGDIRKVMELLTEAGYDCIHPVDAQAGQDLYELKKEFGERVSFMGHIDIMAWSEEQIHKEISLAEDEFKKGGLILGSTCGLSMETVSEKLSVLYPQWEKREGLNTGNG